MSEIELKALEAIRDLKFFCFDCQGVFDEDESAGDPDPNEGFAACPKCGSEEVSSEADEIANWIIHRPPSSASPLEWREAFKNLWHQVNRYRFTPRENGGIEEDSPEYYVWQDVLQAHNEATKVLLVPSPPKQDAKPEPAKCSECGDAPRLEYCDCGSLDGCIECNPKGNCNSCNGSGLAPQPEP